MMLRVHFAVASLAILVLCGTNYWVEYTPTWKQWQKEYYALLAEKIEDPQKAARAANTPPKFVQIYNRELGVTDRCVICHLGMDNPLMAGERNPHKAHPNPGNFLSSHPLEQVGCTICHHGQGAATTLDDAHGHVPHWERPLLTGDFVQATCTKCHNEEEVPGAPVLTRGKRLLRELGCVGCHRTGESVDGDKVGPRLAGIGSKVTRRWLNRWLLNPKGYLPRGKMPNFHLSPFSANALAAYLMTFRNEAIDTMPEQEGDYDAGAQLHLDEQCIDCHVSLERGGKLVGGNIGPDLRKIANKVNQRWLVAFYKDPHAFYPRTKMPRFNFSDQQALNLAQFTIENEDWVDYDLLDADEAAPPLPADSPELKEQGKQLYDELGCAGCHDSTGEPTKPPGPDLTFIGGKPVHNLGFGDAEVRHTLPDFLYTKLKSPRSLTSDFRLPFGEDPAEAIWKNLQPTALFSKSAPLPKKGSDTQRLAWILAQVQERTALPPGWQLPAAAGENGPEESKEPQTPAEPEAPDQQQAPQAPSAAAEGRLAPELKLPDLPPPEQADWLVQKLNEVGLLNSLKMPDFLLSNADAEALTIALMSHSAERVALRRFEVPRKRKVSFNPKDEFGQLERRYRCLSCHSIRGSGDLLASDLTFEGNRVNREWLYHYLKMPYSMRRLIAIAMPNFNFPDEEARFMAEYMSRVFVDSQIGVGWKRLRDRADAGRGKALFDAKGCFACHQLHNKGGDIGPSLTTQVPEFPQGTWVGDKLRGEWIFDWLKDPRAMLPDTLEPNRELSDQEAADLTAYLLSLKNPEYRPKTGGAGVN